MKCRNVMLCIWVVVCGVVSVLDMMWLITLPGQNGVRCRHCACDQMPKSLHSAQMRDSDTLVVERLYRNTSTSDVKGLSYLDKLSRDRYESCQPKERQKFARRARCREATFQDGNNPVVALVSPPGSGNTWVRYLLEQAVGIYTGSIYCDPDLKAIYPGEKVASGSVLVVKTHRYTTRELPTDVQIAMGKKEYDRAILLIRNPYNSLLSEANRKWNTDTSVSNHVGLASDAFLSGKKKAAFPRLHYIIILSQI